jgi:hypothetical protein
MQRKSLIPGLPDVRKTKYHFGYILHLGIENVGTVYGQFEYFMGFDIFYIHLVYIVVIWYKFTPFWYIVPR